MIHTVTLNSGFDQVYKVTEVLFGEVAEVLDHRTVPAGKGINAARVAKALGEPVTAHALVGRWDHDYFAQLLATEGIPSRLYVVDLPMRHNLTVIPEVAGKASAHFRAPGFTLADATPIEHAVRDVRAQTKEGDVVMLNGSSPRGVSDDAWRRIGQAAFHKGGRLVVDVYGPPLVDLLGAVPISVCKPNEHEMYGLPDLARLERWQAVHQALHYMKARGVDLPVVTLGSGGLAFANEDAIWRATCPVPRPRLTVGAGDALAGAFAVAMIRQKARDAVDLARAAIAVAAAFVSGASIESLSTVSDSVLDKVEIHRVGEL